MTAFLLLCVASVVALPILGAWYTGVEVIAPLLWRARLLGQAYNAPRALPPPEESGLAPDPSENTKRLLDEATATRASALSRDFTTAKHALPVYLRALARAVDEAGRAVGLPYTMEEQAETRSVVVAFVVVDLRSAIPERLTFHFELDDEACAFGDEGLIAGLLDGAARHHLGRGDRLTLSDGFLVLEAPFLLADRVPGPVVEAMAAIGGRLARACAPDRGLPRIAALLRENLANDDLDTVRARAVDLLLARFPKDAEVAAERALADEAAEVRFAAARHLEEAGFEVIEAVAFDRTQIGPTADGLRQRALRFLVREFPTDEVLPLLERAVRDGPDALRQIAIRQLGHLEYEPAIPWLNALSRSREPETIVAGCETLAQLGPNPASEAILVELMEREETVILKAAVDAVAQVGTVASVPSLERVLEKTSSRELRLSAATAIQLVQSRGAPAVIGALSLVDDARGAGQLALADGVEKPETPPVPTSDPDVPDVA